MSCENPNKCAEEAMWMHNPHKRWTIIGQPICNGSQGACYAFPPGTVFGFSIDAPNSYFCCSAIRIAAANNKSSILSRMIKWLKS